MTPATKHNDDSVVQTARTAPRSDRSFLIARWLFVRCLAALYLVTFLSLLWQIPGLLGENGISPAQENLGLARFTLGAERYLAFPTLFWLDSSDAFLYLLCGAGVVGSCLVFLGVAPSLLVPFLWLVHLSFFTVGEDEVRAWPVANGSTAKEAAGKIHSDIEKGFIRAETVAYDDFIADGGMAGARTAGHFRLEGRDYIVRDGDIMNYRFSHGK